MKQSMRHDVWQLDRELMALRERRRRALDALGTPLVAGPRSPGPFDSPLFRLHDELREADDPVARGIAEWLDVLVVERATWEHRTRLEAAWREEHRVAHLDDPISLIGLRRALLREVEPRLRSAHRAGLVACCRAASDLAVVGLVWRLEREGCAYLGGEGRHDPAALARRVLAVTDDFVADVGSGVMEHARAAVCAEANEGWPARLTTRWLGDVFAGSGVGDGLDVKLGALPEAWGAMSFARALGGLGSAVLDAARPKSVPFSIHKRPRGHRQHARRALFAAVVLEQPFARRVLGLGADRVRDHQRHVARSIALALRFDALRVLLTARLAEGEESARSALGEISERHFGQAADVALLGVLPRLRPADGPALVGAVMAFQHRLLLVNDHDEDWFRNPRAMETLRDEDERLPPEAPSAEVLEAAVDALSHQLERALG